MGKANKRRRLAKVRGGKTNDRRDMRLDWSKLTYLSERVNGNSGRVPAPAQTNERRRPRQSQKVSSDANNKDGGRMNERTEQGVQVLSPRMNLILRGKMIRCKALRKRNP